MPHLELTPKTDISSFRKLAIGSWQTTYDPTVYGTLTVRMDKALAYIEAFRQRTGVRLTVTHLVTKAMGEALRRCPDANAILRFNKIYLRKQVTISALVVQTDGGQGRPHLGEDRRRGQEEPARDRPGDGGDGAPGARAPRRGAGEGQGDDPEDPLHVPEPLHLAARLPDVHAEPGPEPARHAEGRVRLGHHHQRGLARAGHAVRAAGALHARAHLRRARRGEGGAGGGGRQGGRRAR